MLISTNSVNPTQAYLPNQQSYTFGVCKLVISKLPQVLQDLTLTIADPLHKLYLDNLSYLSGGSSD
jgi:hypothetical protein